MSGPKPSEQCKNLYRFIRLVMGEDLSDREIARRWNMDEKNLRELKQGVRVVPKLTRLERLAEVMGIRKYYVLEAASGVPAEKVFQLLRSRILEDALHGIETAFGSNHSHRNEAEEGKISAGLQSAAFLAYRFLEPQELFVRVSQELKRFEFESHVFSLDQDRGSATIRHSSFSPRMVRMAESITGLSLGSFNFPLDRVRSFHPLFKAKMPVYLPDASVLLHEILGDRPLKKFVAKMKGIFPILEVSLAPITVRGELTGVFALGRHGRLNEAHLPEIRFFADHLSCSLENAMLFQQVKQSEGRLQNLFERLPEGVFACDRDGMILEMNPAGANILGFENRQGPIGQSIQNFRVLTPDARAVRKQIKKSKRTVIQNLVGVAHKVDGSPFLIDVSYRTDYDRSGSPLKTEGVFRDVSQRTI